MMGQFRNDRYYLLMSYPLRRLEGEKRSITIVLCVSDGTERTKLRRREGLVTEQKRPKGGEIANQECVVGRSKSQDPPQGKGKSATASHARRK